MIYFLTGVEIKEISSYSDVTTSLLSNLDETTTKDVDMATLEVTNDVSSDNVIAMTSTESEQTSMTSTTTVGFPSFENMDCSLESGTDWLGEGTFT